MNEYVEAKRCMPAQLLAQLSAAKGRVMQEVGARDVLDFELAWRPFDEANDLTDTQARAIWREYGFPEGSSIILRPDPYEGSETWKLLCDSSERRAWSSVLQKLLFPSESGGAAAPAEAHQRGNFMTEQERDKRREADLELSVALWRSSLARAVLHFTCADMVEQVGDVLVAYARRFVAQDETERYEVARASTYEELADLLVENWRTPWNK